MAKRATREELGVQPGNQIIIQGEVDFSHVLTKIEGEELKKAQDHQRSRNQIIQEKPYYTIVLKNPQVVFGQGTPLALFHESTFYSKSDGSTATSMISKSLFPATIQQYIDAGGKQLMEIKPTHEFAKGQVVQLVITAYKPKNYNNMASTFDQILVPAGEVKYYTGGNAATSLAGFGFTTVPNPDLATQSVTPTVPEQPVATQVPPMTTIPPVQPETPVMPTQPVQPATTTVPPTTAPPFNPNPTPPVTPGQTDNSTFVNNPFSS